MKQTLAAWTACSFLLLAGCSENQQSIYREANLGSGISPITDAKQRIVVNRQVSLDDKGNVMPGRIICAEPSPDVSQAIAEAIKASGSFDLSKASPAGATPGEKAIAVGFERSVAAQVAQLGERLAAIQLLRDKMYRACEAYANGAVGPTAYTLMQARLDKTMATLLSSEMAAGAFGRALAAVGGGASTSGVDPKALKDAEKGVLDAKDALVAAKDDAARTAAAQKLNDAVATLTTLERLSGGTGAGIAGGLSLPGGIAGHPGAAGAAFVARIHRGYIDDDGLEPLVDACITAMERVKAPVDQLKAAFRETSPLAKVNIDTTLSNLRDAENKLQNSEKRLADLEAKVRDLRAKRERSKEEAAELADVETYGIPRAKTAIGVDRQNIENLKRALVAAGASAPAPAKNAGERITETYLNAGEPFAAFCYTAVFADDAPFVGTRLKAKQDLRTIDATRPPRDLKGEACTALLKDATIAGFVGGDLAKAPAHTRAALKSYCGIEAK